MRMKKKVEKSHDNDNRNHSIRINNNLVKVQKKVQCMVLFLLSFSSSWNEERERSATIFGVTASSTFSFLILSSTRYNHDHGSWFMYFMHTMKLPIAQNAFEILPFRSSIDERWKKKEPTNERTNNRWKSTTISWNMKYRAAQFTKIKRYNLACERSRSE